MKSPDAAGFSLVEILVVLVIISVLSSAAVLSVGASDQSSRVDVEAQRLVLRFQMAADEVLVTGRSVSLHWDSHGYSFGSRNSKESEWEDDPHPMLGKRHELPPNLQLRTEQEAESVVVGSDGTQAELVLETPGTSPGVKIRFNGYHVTIIANP